MTEIAVTTHVARDLLQSAAAFKSEAAVIWEYVANSLQYVDRGVAPVVQVDILPKQKEIRISDNGRGMTAAELRHFFQMHGENRDRRAGRGGRGKFGTGKSAAFGIATTLQVDTVRNGLRNVVELKRDAIKASDGQNIPVTHLARDEKTAEPNGTIVTIGGVLLPRIDSAQTIDYLERHLSVFRAVSPRVAVNQHVCEPKTPVIAAEHRFRPLPDQKSVLGDVELIIKVSQAPLPEADQGVMVTAGAGNLVAVERAGMDHKDMGSYLFGEIDVPAIEADQSGIEPYDATRSLQLNPRNPVVAILIMFIGSKLEQVRLGLVAEQRKARQTEQARRLAQESARLADILNQDFKDQSRRLNEIRSASRAGTAPNRFGDSAMGGAETDLWVEGTEEPGVIVTPDRTRCEGDGGRGRKDPNITRAGERTPDGPDSVNPAGGTRGRRSRPRGGFNVDYKALGADEGRSVYDPATMTIVINLDHPVVSAALGLGGVEEPAFQRLSYEIAFSEYAIALSYEMAKIDPEVPADDLLYDIRTTLNRVARSAASLYRA